MAGLDTMEMWLPSERIGTDFLAQIPLRIDVEGEHKNKWGQFYITGYKRNYKIVAFESGVSLKGSIRNYDLKDISLSQGREGVIYAIEKMSDELLLPVESALIRRVDVAHDFIMDYCPETYFPYLGNCQYYERFHQPNSLYYQNHKKTKVFYNKRAQLKTIGVNLPLLWVDKNILRYELRLTSRLPKQFNIPELTPKMLTKEEIYNGLMKKWGKEYEDITKMQSIKLNHKQMKTPKDFFKQLLLIKINEIGQVRILELVEELRAKKVFEKPEYYSRLKNDIKSLCNNPVFTEPVELVEEMDTKIRSVIELK